MRSTAHALESILLVACCCCATAAEEPRARWWPFGEKSEATAEEDNSLAAAWPQTSASSQAATQPMASTAGAAATPASATYPTTLYPSTPIPSMGAPATGESAAQAQSSLTDHATEEYPERRWMFQSPLARVSWPRIHFPEFSRPRLPRPQLWPRKSDVDEARNAWVQTNPAPARPSPLQAMREGAQRVGQSTRSAWRKTVDVLTPGEASGSDSARMARGEERPSLLRRMFTVEEPEPQTPRTVTEWMAQERLEP